MASYFANSCAILFLSMYPFVYNSQILSLRISETLSLINMSAIRGLHYKVRKLFLIEQRNREFNEFKEAKEIKV